MAKKYYGSSKGSMEAMECYAGYDARRRREIEDGNMLNENHSAIANMPQEVKYHDWPASPIGASYNLNDDIRGIDNQMRDDLRGEKKGEMPEKY